ncbi:OmpA family protein [Pararhodobacter zhoushanensis]|uniref:OmpA family protein n=1 Tax=Pararhodobacter zhoushanensis TaxID=2479545 RepID=A0ABT3GY06_9RHOB|nr:OmpA family protein [Pararhodobacter zhoushanensis]MCW1932444.1 OmpA family protein [Pararhodobacter zhoushanensis]
MRLATGLAILATGVVALGWWARAEYAPFLQERLALSAQTVAAASVHGVQATVSGRDITVSGLADGPGEQVALIAALDGLRGRRVVVDRLEVLPVADPYVLHVARRGGVLTTRGSVPSDAAQAMLQGEGVDGLTLAAGAPDAHWPEAAMAGLGGLNALEEGHFDLTGRSLSLLGLARTSAEEQAAHAAVADILPEGYDFIAAIDVLDDGTPPAYQLHYTAEAGPWLQGKLPLGVSAGDVAAALGLEDIDDGARVALLGEPGQVSPVVSALASWLGEVETLDVAVSPGGTVVDAGFGAGADLDLLGAALGADLARASNGLTLHLNQVVPEVAEGSERVHALSGRAEVLSGGYWLPVAGFAPTMQSCAENTDATLAANHIGFVTGSARLDARARSAVNAVAGVMRACVTAGLRAEIGGHTDATGATAANLTLSQSRAEAVRTALVARGVPADGMTAQGYGAAQPVGENDTETGRAANRRTAVRWIE